MAKQRSAPTLNDVAQKAGVSTATVSRCLNSPDQVIEPTRKRVMEAVRELGYSPNFGGRALAAKRTNTIGAIIPTMENAIFARGVQAFQEELRARGYTLLVASSSYRADVEEDQIRTLIARGADGLMLIGHDRDPSIYRFLETQGVPALITWTHMSDAEVPSIGFDNKKSMRELVDKVLDLGHRRIGVISAETASNDRARARVEAIREALRSPRYKDASVEIVETVYDIDAGAVAFRDLMSTATPPTAILCGNDVIAAGALRQARVMGLDVPNDVSVTGFDDIELARIVTPALTTVHVPHREMGTQAARQLIEMVEKNAPGQTIEIPAQVCLRDSLGPPPSACSP